IRHTPILSAVQALSDQDLRALARLCCMNGKATFEQIVLFHQITADSHNKLQDSLKCDLERFTKAGLIALDGELIGFAGDERETMYAKYYGRKRNVGSLIQKIG